MQSWPELDKWAHCRSHGSLRRLRLDSFPPLLSHDASLPILPNPSSLGPRPASELENIRQRNPKIHSNSPPPFRAEKADTQRTSNGCQSHNASKAQPCFPNLLCLFCRPQDLLSCLHFYRALGFYFYLELFSQQLFASD